MRMLRVGVGSLLLLFLATWSVGCSGDDCGTDGDCGSGEVCVECDTLTANCNKCVEAGDSGVCSCAF